MKPTFESDRGYLFGFCFLWLLLTGELVQAFDLPFLTSLVTSWLVVEVALRADPARGSPGFVARFIPVATESLLWAIGAAILMFLALVIYWILREGGIDAGQSRFRDASESGVASADGRFLMAILLLSWALMLWQVRKRFRDGKDPHRA